MDDLARRHPLATPTGLALLKRLSEDADAPAWNHAAGDLLAADDLQAVHAFACELGANRRSTADHPADALLTRLSGLHPRIPLWRARLAAGFDFAARWREIPFTSREDIATRCEQLVPDDADLDRLLVYRTAGTTGHALLVPHDRIAIACYNPLILAAFARYGIVPVLDETRVACFNIGAQAQTVTYPSLLASLAGAGFAKLNLKPQEWPTEGAAARYIERFAPAWLSGDPISFAELLRQGIAAEPQALLTTAVALSPALKTKLETAYGCPVIDWYSLTETGPLAYACRLGHGYHLLPHDIFVETIDADGHPVADGELGEITVSGGRNPYLPMLRYRTGDWGRIDRGACACGDAMPRLIDLEGRMPVCLRAADGNPVNTADVSRALRHVPLVAHELVQRADGSIDFRYRSVEALPAARIASCLREVFGDLVLRLSEDAALGQRTASGKAMPYRSELDPGLLDD